MEATDWLHSGTVIITEPLCMYYCSVLRIPCCKRGFLFDDTHRTILVNRNSIGARCVYTVLLLQKFTRVQGATSHCGLVRVIVDTIGFLLRLNLLRTLPGSGGQVWF
jgi:hypothetical protein